MIPIFSGTPAAASASFSATLLSTLVPQVFTGSSTPTFTRATTAYVTDFEGLLKQVPSGASRHTGARFVRNFVLKSADLGGAGWAGDATATSATLLTNAVGAGTFSRRYYGTTIPSSRSGSMRCRVKAGTATFLRVALNQSGDCGITMNLSTGAVTNNYNGGAYTLATYGVSSSVDAEGYWTVFLVCAAATDQTFNNLLVAIVDSGSAGSNYTYTGSGNLTAYVTDVQVEVTDGQTIKTPSEYVSVGVLSAPFHGANVDGVKYFTTQNGNTVSSNVVTEATGAAISSATLLGYHAEGARTNLVLQSQVAGTTWAVTNVTVGANTLAAPDGTTTADTLTATAGNGTWLQGVTVASAVKTFSIWLRRKTGTGNIDMTLDNGTGWTTKTISSSWARYEITQTLANPTVGIRIVTSGDEVYVWGAQLEDGVSFASSYIPTTTVAVARNTDALTYVTLSNLSGTIGTAFAEAQYVGLETINCLIGLGGAGGFALFSTATNTVGVNDVATNTTTTGSGSLFTIATRKVASAWGGATKSVSKDGAAAASGSFDGDMNAPASFSVGNYVSGSYPLFGNIRNLSIWSTKKTDAELTTLTT